MSGPLLVLALVVGGAAPTLAKPRLAVEPTFGVLYREGGVLPLRIRLITGEEDAGRYSIRLRAPGSRVEVSGVLDAASPGTRELNALWPVSQERELRIAAVGAASAAPDGLVLPLDPLPRDTLLVAVLGPDPVGLARLGTGPGDRLAWTQVEPPYPEDCAGWSAVDVVVWPAADPRAWTSASVAALVQWVGSGGGLVLGPARTSLPFDAARVAPLEGFPQVAAGRFGHGRIAVAAFDLRARAVVQGEPEALWRAVLGAVGGAEPRRPRSLGGTAWTVRQPFAQPWRAVVLAGLLAAYVLGLIRITRPRPAERPSIRSAFLRPHGFALGAAAVILAASFLLRRPATSLRVIAIEERADGWARGDVGGVLSAERAGRHLLRAARSSLRFVSAGAVRRFDDLAGWLDLSDREPRPILAAAAHSVATEQGPWTGVEVEARFVEPAPPGLRIAPAGGGWWVQSLLPEGLEGLVLSDGSCCSRAVDLAAGEGVWLGLDESSCRIPRDGARALALRGFPWSRSQFSGGADPGCLSATALRSIGPTYLEGASRVESAALYLELCCEDPS